MVKTALIGAGYWGSKLQDTLKHVPECEVVQVLDIKKNETIEDLQWDVQAVVIATPACTPRAIPTFAATPRPIRAG